MKKTSFFVGLGLGFAGGFAASQYLVNQAKQRLMNNTFDKALGQLSLDSIQDRAQPALDAIMNLMAKTGTPTDENDDIVFNSDDKNLSKGAYGK